MKAKLIFYTVTAIIGISMLIGGAIWKDVRYRYSDTTGTVLIVIGSVVGAAGFIMSMIYATTI